MPLTVGDRLAHYDVTALIGEGGMGQVYQATDTKLNRQVALKILPEAFAGDPDRLARFQREAQVLASLNHPGIVVKLVVDRRPARVCTHPWKRVPIQVPRRIRLKARLVRRLTEKVMGRPDSR